MFFVALFTVANKWKEPKSPSSEEWIKKIWYIYSMNYYSSLKMNETLSFGKMWIERKIIMISEINQAQKKKCHVISLICRILKSWSHRT